MCREDLKEIVREAERERDAEAAALLSAQRVADDAESLAGAESPAGAEAAAAASSGGGECEGGVRRQPLSALRAALERSLAEEVRVVITLIWGAGD